jgi:hypothetical protein
MRTKMRKTARAQRRPSAVAGGRPGTWEQGVVQEVDWTPDGGVTPSSLQVTIGGDPGTDPVTGESTIQAGVRFSDTLTPQAGDTVWMLRIGRSLMAVFSLEP